MFNIVVQSVTHYTDRLFSIVTTRPREFKFLSGEFAMIGLEQDPGALFRAYSICSSPYDDYLEFYSIKVAGGPFTEQLKLTRPGDNILLRPKTTGSLVVDYLKPKRNLIMLSTGTGIAPFVSIIQDMTTYERFENVYLFHTVREAAELNYGMQKAMIASEFFSNFTYVPTVTRSPFSRQGRFWDHLNDYVGPGLRRHRDAVMICGSPDLNKQCRRTFADNEWVEGNVGYADGDFMLERAFAD